MLHKSHDLRYCLFTGLTELWEISKWRYAVFAKGDVMDGHDWSRKYEEAIVLFERHIRVLHGQLFLDAEDGNSIGVEDPVVFADLKRSLDETNKKIKNREISLEDVHFLENSR
jgi:hypothetical protein